MRRKILKKKNFIKYWPAGLTTWKKDLDDSSSRGEIRLRSSCWSCHHLNAKVIQTITLAVVCCTLFTLGWTHSLSLSRRSYPVPLDVKSPWENESDIASASGDCLTSAVAEPNFFQGNKEQKKAMLLFMNVIFSFSERILDLPRFLKLWK
jgi:hypothetical protein